MLIKARLQGHECDLLTLAELFREGDPAVATDDEGYYLSFSVPDELFRDGGGLHDGALVLAASGQRRGPGAQQRRSAGGPHRALQ